MTIKPVTDDVAHEAALRRIDELLGSDPTSDDGKELDAILTLVERYEQQRWPLTGAFDPVDLLKQAMSPEVGHTRAELIEIIGSASRVSELLARKRSLSLGHIGAISDAWGIPMQLLSAPYEIEGRAGSRGVVSRAS